MFTLLSVPVSMATPRLLSMAVGDILKGSQVFQCFRFAELGSLLGAPLLRTAVTACRESRFSAMMNSNDAARIAAGVHGER